MINEKETQAMERNTHSQQCHRKVQTSSKPGCGIQFRYIVLLLCTTATLLEYATKVNLDVAIVQMVKPVAVDDANPDTKPIVIEICGPAMVVVNNSTNGTNIEGRGTAKTYPWPQTTQGLILGASFYGYIMLQIPFGRISELFGGKHIVTAAILTSGVINLLTPVLSESVAALVTSRVVLGLLQGGVFPACFSILCKIMPRSERAFANSILNVGGNLGAVCATSIAGYLAQYGFAGGWPSVFYVFGSVATAWIAIWLLIVRVPKNAPEEPDDEETLDNADTKSISSIESGQDALSSITVQPKVPWLEIMTSLPVAATYVARFAGGFGYLTLQTKLPGYLHDVLHVSITNVS